MSAASTPILGSQSPSFDNFFRTEYGITIRQDSRRSLGGWIWFSAVTICKYFSQLRDMEWSNKRILELGSGTGAVGIFLARQGAQVTLTDQKSQLDLLRYNTAINVTERDEQMFVEELEWLVGWLVCSQEQNLMGNVLQQQTSPTTTTTTTTTWDIIVGSDILYFEEQYEDLLKTLVQSSSPTTVIYIAREVRRRHVEDKFFEMAAARFDVVKVHTAFHDVLGSEVDVHLMTPKK